jgi:hypothetical protein
MGVVTGGDGGWWWWWFGLLFVDALRIGKYYYFQIRPD